jgi:hypothetical protein
MKIPLPTTTVLTCEAETVEEICKRSGLSVRRVREILQEYAAQGKLGVRQEARGYINTPKGKKPVYWILDG